MPEMKCAVKDSVFTYLFKQPEYTRLLYLALHPEDEDVTEQDCKLITLENVISTGIYNDLGFQVRDKLFLSELYDGTGDAEIHVKVLSDEKSGDILAQYVRFCKIVDMNRRLHGSTQKALDETFHQCKEENILTSFLASRKKEVTDIMVTLFDNDTIQEIHDFNVARDAEEKGEANRDRLYNELIKQLAPLGRIDDVIAATSDKAKLSDLAKEFGIKI